MDNIQIIIESPHQNETHKKRPRLVTSCDNCRLKKIKCIQPITSHGQLHHPTETACEACRVARISCHFKDREKYFAERSRAIAGPSISKAHATDRKAKRASADPYANSNSRSRRSHELYDTDSSSSSRQASQSPDFRRSYQTSPTPGMHDSYAYHHSRNSSSDYSSNSSHSIYATPDYTGASSFPLFDPHQGDQPHHSIMPQLIQVFFGTMGAEYPYLTYQDIMTRFYNGTLSPLLSSCIAALAARYSDMPELAMRGLHNVGETYINNAKTILSPLLYMAGNTETVQALMMVSAFELKNNRASESRAYCQAAVRMAVNIGLSDENIIRMHTISSERSRLRATWASLSDLQVTLSSLN